MCSKMSFCCSRDMAVGFYVRDQSPREKMGNERGRPHESSHAGHCFCQIAYRAQAENLHVHLMPLVAHLRHLLRKGLQTVASKRCQCLRYKHQECWRSPGMNHVVLMLCFLKSLRSRGTPTSPEYRPYNIASGNRYYHKERHIHEICRVASPRHHKSLTCHQ